MPLTDAAFSTPEYISGIGVKASALATVAEAASFLHLSVPMIHKLIAEDKVPSRRYGRAVRIPWVWLQAEVNGAAGGLPIKR
jgi:excisionase family DNA binding protein